MLAQVCESNWVVIFGCTDFPFRYVLDFRFQFIWIFDDFLVRNSEVNLGIGQRRNISRQQLGMKLF